MCHKVIISTGPISYMKLYTVVLLQAAIQGNCWFKLVENRAGVWRVCLDPHTYISAQAMGGSSGNLNRHWQD